MNLIRSDRVTQRVARTMNLFRLLFLAIVLIASFSVAVVNLVPEVIERVTNDALEDRARVEALLLHEREQRADFERRALAQRVALQDSLVRALSAPPGFGGPPAGSMFRQASAPLWNDATLDLDGLFLLGPDSAIVDARTRGSVDAALLERAGASDVLSTGITSTSFVTAEGGLYAVTTVPISVNRRAVGAVSLVQLYDAALVADRRSGAGANAAWFVGRDIVASNVTDDAVAEEAARAVQALTPEAIGLPNMLRSRDVVDVRGGFGQQRVLIAPVRVGPLAEASPEFGVLTIVQGPVPSTNPVESISNSGVLDEGSMRIWVTMAIGLIAFFVGLFLLDAALERATRTLARQIREDATANDPLPLIASDYPAWVRSIVDSFNVFLEAYRSHTPQARRARAEHGGSGAYDRTTGSGAGPLVLPRVEAALEASGESMWSGVDSQPSIDLAPDEFEKIPTGMLRLDTGEQVTVGSVARRLERAAESPEEFAEQVADEGSSEAAEEILEEAAVEDAILADAPEDEGLDDSEAIDDAADEFLRDLSGESAPVRADEDAEDPESHSSIERPIAPLDAAEDEDATFEVIDVEPATDDDEASDFDDSESPLFDGVDEEPTLHVPLPTQSAAGSMFAEDEAEAALVDDVSDSLEAALSGPHTAIKPRSETSIPVIDGVEGDSGVPFEQSEAPEHSSMFRDVSAEDAEEARAAIADASDVSALIAQIHAPPRPADDEVDEDQLDEVEATVVAELEASATDDVDGTGTLPGFASASHAVAEEEAIEEEAIEEEAIEEEAIEEEAVEEEAIEEEAIEEEAVEEEAIEEDASEEEAASARASALDEEADDEDAPQELVEGSATVPRVALEDLAAQASERTGQGPDLLAAAEARLRALRPGAEPSTDHRELYERFVRAKQSCDEDTSRLTVERFTTKLERNREALMKRYQCSDVQFQVVIREGKVTLKATPIR